MTAPTTKQSRVAVLAHRLPLEVGAAIAGRVRWIRQELGTIDRELQLTYPLIEVVPICWTNQLADGHAGHVPGRVTVSRGEDGANRFVVQITAPALLEYGDDLIVGILAHEFLHVVHHTLAVHNHAAASSSDEGIALDLSQPGYNSSWGDYRRLDVKLQVADGARWLGPRLQRHAEMVDEHESSTVDAALARIISTWVKAGLPVEQPDLNYQVDNISIDMEIINRAAELCSVQEKP